MKNGWEKKATCSAYLSTIIKHFLEFAPSNGNGPTDLWTRLEHAHCLETINNMWFLGKRVTAPCWRKRTLTDSEIKRNRSEVSSKDNNSDNDSFGSFFFKKSYLLQHNSVLIFILWRSVRKSTIILDMKKLRSW
jgi:hypothetical protein